MLIKGGWCLCSSWFGKHGAALDVLCGLITKMKGNKPAREQWVEYAKTSVNSEVVDNELPSVV